MHAGWVNAPMNGSDIFTAPAALYAFHVAVVRVPVAVQLMHTSPAALSFGAGVLQSANLRE